MFQTLRVAESIDEAADSLVVRVGEKDENFTYRSFRMLETGWHGVSHSQYKVLSNLGAGNAFHAAEHGEQKHNSYPYVDVHLVARVQEAGERLNCLHFNL